MHHPHYFIQSADSVSPVLPFLLYPSAVLLAVFRSWLYLLCVAYKVSRRLGLLAFHNFWDRLTGTLLTFLGMFLGLWQNMGYAVLDLAIDVLLMKLAVSLEFWVHHSTL